MSDSPFQTVLLETERLTVRVLCTADAVSLHAVVSRPEVMKFLPEDVMSLEDVREAIEWFEDCNQVNTADRIRKWTLGVVWNDNSEVIGWCGLGPLDFEPEHTELYCGLTDSFWGRGIAAEACRALLDYALTSIGITRIFATVNPDNRQSRRLIEKLGMRFERRVHGLPEEHRFYEGFLLYSISK